MLIEGPFLLGIVEKQDSLGRELHLDFTQEFRALELEEQAVRFTDYLKTLQASIQVAEDGPDRQGMLVIQQVSEQLLPHIEAGELPLGETVVIEIQPDSPLGQLIPVQSTIN